MTMALQVFTDVMGLLWQHPVFSCLLLLLFTPPLFPIVKFFSPLLISTALFMLALFTMGPQTDSHEHQGDQENWEFRRVADVKVWEDNTVGEYKRLTDGSWMDWLSNLQEAGLAWIEARFRNENWKGSSLNDDNVSILQEASWAKSDPSTSEEAFDFVPAMVDTKLTRFSISKVDEEPAQVPVMKSQYAGSSVHHEPLVSLQIPKRGVTIKMIDESPNTDLEESTDLELSRRLVRRKSVNASSGLSDSDIDTPAAVITLSKSGKLKQIENLGDLIEVKEHAEKTGEEVPNHELAVLKPTIADQVEAVKDKLEDFTHKSGEIKPVKESIPNVKKAPGSPLFKKKSSSAFSDDDSSSGEEELSDDSDSDTEFEIFPPIDPKKMKLHPPVKLDIKQLEIKLGTSLTPPKGEITEVQ